MEINELQKWWALHSVLGPVLGGAIGGLISCGFQVLNHSKRKLEDKLPWPKYLGFGVFLILALPFLGALVIGLYIAAGDSFSALLAVQTGAGAPLLVQGWVTSSANKQTHGSKELEPNQ